MINKPYMLQKAQAKIPSENNINQNENLTQATVVDTVIDGVAFSESIQIAYEPQQLGDWRDYNISNLKAQGIDPKTHSIVTMQFDDRLKSAALQAISEKVEHLIVTAPQETTNEETNKNE